MEDEMLILGASNTRSNVRYVPLDWHAMPLEVDAEGRVKPSTLKEIRAIPGRGLYAIEGSHDAHNAGCILYVGVSAKDGSDDRLGKRIIESLGLGAHTEKLANRGRLWSTFWNITLRWTSIGKKEPSLSSENLREIEKLLIQSHLPPLNSHEIKGFHKGPAGLVVLNAGAKGRLLPCVVSDYYRAELWPPGSA